MSEKNNTLSDSTKVELLRIAAQNPQNIANLIRVMKTSEVAKAECFRLFDLIKNSPSEEDRKLEIIKKVIESENGAKVIAEAIRASDDQIASSSEVFRLLNKIYTIYVSYTDHISGQRRAIILMEEIYTELDFLYDEDIHEENLISKIECGY